MAPGRALVVGEGGSGALGGSVAHGPGHGMGCLLYTSQVGDRVEVLTQKSASPARDWLNSVKTPSARSKIRSYFSKITRADYMQMGRDMLVREMRKHGLGPVSYTHLDVYKRQLIADVPPLRNELELKRMAMARLGKQVVEMCIRDRARSLRWPSKAQTRPRRGSIRPRR